MEERKSMGSALVDVFDAGVVLVKSEINGIARKVGDIAKAKGMGAVLLLAALGPILLGLTFLILAIFYGLMRLGLGAWAAALVIALVSFLIAGGLAMVGLQKLSANVETDLPRRPVPVEPSSSAFTPAPVAASAASSPSTAAGAGPVGPASAPASDPADNSALTANTTVYESKPSGEAALYGSGLNKKLHHHDDPNLQNPVPLRGSAGIAVSTKPTYPDDMKKEGY